jgi:hypothetical protein
MHRRKPLHLQRDRQSLQQIPPVDAADVMVEKEKEKVQKVRADDGVDQMDREKVRADERQEAKVLHLSPKKVRADERQKAKVLHLSPSEHSCKVDVNEPRADQQRQSRN